MWFTYEVGKTYRMKKSDVKLCNKGFHAAADCDISNTVDYYFTSNTEYALVDINVTDRDAHKVVGNQIRIIRKLESLEEMISYDKTGRWCYDFRVF